MKNLLPYRQPWGAPLPNRGLELSETTMIPSIRAVLLKTCSPVYDVAASLETGSLSLSRLKSASCKNNSDVESWNVPLIRSPFPLRRKKTASPSSNTPRGTYTLISVGAHIFLRWSGHCWDHDGLANPMVQVAMDPVSLASRMLIRTLLLSLLVLV